MSEGRVRTCRDALLAVVIGLSALSSGARAAPEFEPAPLSLASAPRPTLQGEGLWTCQVDLQHHRLSAFYTDQRGVPFAKMAHLVAWLSANGEELLCATNGGIFAVGGRPLGWLVADGVLLNSINWDQSSPGNFFMQPNGALIIDVNGARIETTSALMQDAPSDVSHISLALQSGPMLLQDGAINARFDRNSTSLYTRNSVCVLDATHVILAYSERLLSLYQFAQQLQRIGCRQALYLDGHVSQMYPSAAEPDPAQRRDLSVFIGVTARIKDE